MAASEQPTEQPGDKDLQDHRFGITAAQEQERAEKAEEGPGDERPEPHAGGRA